MPHDKNPNCCPGNSNSGLALRVRRLNTQPTPLPDATKDDQADTDNTYTQPEWISLFTSNQKVLAYRWYQADNCPSGNYSFKDDLYIFDTDEVLSELEIQARNPTGGIIGTGGFHSASGYICVALSEVIHPSNYLALHELAHAIVYVQHGLTGHNKIFDARLIELALLFDGASCLTDDLRLRDLIAWNKPIFALSNGIPLPKNKRYSTSVTHQHRTQPQYRTALPSLAASHYPL